MQLEKEKTTPTTTRTSTITTTASTTTPKILDVELYVDGIKTNPEFNVN